MRKITLLSFFALFSSLAFGQTPCFPISPLDCSEIGANLPVDLNFDGTGGGILNTGFTMVDAPSARLASDNAGADPNITGLLAGNISVIGSSLNVTATNGINFSQLTGSPQSTFTNSQMNALGVAFTVSSNVIEITSTIAQPDFVGTTNSGESGSQQAGIWFGINENNFIKLVVVKVSPTEQKIQMALEQTDPGNPANLIITEFNTTEFGVGGISEISFRISIDPTDNSIRGFYALNNGSEAQISGETDFLTAPNLFLDGVDHDADSATDSLSFAGIMTSTRRASGGSMVISYRSFSVKETAPPTAPFEAHVNFQNNPSFTTPPTGYLADYGKAFGNAKIIMGVDEYDFGWKLASDGTTPIDISNEATNNGGTGATGGAGRNRIVATYSGASDQEKLLGTLIHFQGDNVIGNTGGSQSWAGQPRGSEAIWELEVPNGTYEVTVGLGDKDVANLDSRHSATIEGYTIIPAFIPSPGQTIVETMIVEVTDGFLTMNGLGGFNSKITHIDVVESTATPVNGILVFDPSSASETLVNGTEGTFSSSLSGTGASTIGLVIDDNINAIDKNVTNANDWLTLPATDAIGNFTFAMDATTLSEGETRNNTIIASAKGFRPASLEANITVSSAPIVEITAPYRMNVAGGEAIKEGDTFLTEDLAYLVERDGASDTSNTSYTPNPGDTGLYFPRRYNPDFGYAFPIANGNYTVAVHMVENFFTETGKRIFDVILEGNVVVDDLDLVTTSGKGVLNLATFDVTVSDGELNIDFLASVNNGIVQAIEILPVILSNETDILALTLTEQTGNAAIDSDLHTVAIEVNNGTDLTALVPTITISEDATVTPASGTITDFSTSAVTYTVTAEDGTTTQDWAVTVTEGAEVNTALVINEIMINPAAVTDSEGEWFELYNPGTEDVNINGWIIKDNNADSHVIASDGGQLLVPASGYLVLGNNSDVGTNGGKIVDYRYSGFILANTGDEVVLVDDADNEIDRVEYDGATFPNPQGSSIALNAPTDDNTIGSNWSVAVAVFGDGDLGTPGVTNNGKANESPVIASVDTIEVEENQTAVVDMEVSDDIDSEGDGITYSFSGGVDDTLFGLDTDTGVLNFLVEPDFEIPADDGADNIYEIQITATDSEILTDIQDIAITVTDVVEIEPCTPLSTLACDQLEETLPLSLDFTAASGNLSESGMTMVLAPSARLASDDAVIPNMGIPGYAPDLIVQDANGLTITSTKGILFSQLQNIGRTPNSANTNSQLNALGVGLRAPAATFSVSTTLVVPDFSASAGNSSQQAGIWYGLDEDRYVKLVLSKTGATSQRVQLQVEDLTNNPGSIVEVNMDGFSFTVGEAIKLRLEFDPVANTVQGYYTATATEVLVTDGSADFIAVPDFYFDGISYNTANPTDLLNFAGIFTTHRNAAVDQSLDFLFKDFAIEEVTAPLSDQAEISTFVINGIDGTIASTGIDSGTVTLEVLDDADLSALLPTITVSNLATIAPASGVEVDFTDPVDYVVTAENGATKTWTVTVNKGNSQTDGFAFIEDFDAYSPTTGNLDAISNGDWVKQGGDELLAGIPVRGEGLTSGTSFSLEINNSNAIAVHDFQKLIDAPVSLQANVPFYYGTYFNIAELGGIEGSRVRVAIRVDDDGGEAAAWVRHIIGRYGGNINARLGLAGSNSNSGEITIDPDQTLQFVVKGIWDGLNTISYEYTIAPTLIEGDNVWIPASDTQLVNGTPKLGRIFISSTSASNNGKIGPIRLSTDYLQVVTEEIIETPSPCNPFSTLPCDQIVASVPVDLNFDGTGGGLGNTGFTMVDPYSGTRVADDGSASNTEVPGYEPGNLSVSNDNLVLTANKGIAYLDNNAQINTLGIGFQNTNSSFTVETKLLGITTGGNSAQAGIWFGIDDENFVKLDVNNDNIELRREIGGVSVNGADSPDQIQVDNLGASGQDVTLRLVVDPQAETLTAFYAIADAAFVQLTKSNFDNLALPAAYLTGKEINAEIGNASFAGLFATYRNSTNSFDATFDYFKVSEEATLSFDVAELNFSGETGASIPSQTVTLSASSGTPTVILSDDPDAVSWLILPTDPVLGVLEFGIMENLAPGSYSTSIFAIDQPDLGYDNGELQINLEITEPVNDFAVNINFSDSATPAPANYEKDEGDTYADRGNGYTYGWSDANTSAPADLRLNGRNREVAGVSVLNNTLSHMQYGDVSTNAANGYLSDAKWEIEVPNGSYLVTVFVGDPNVDSPAANIPAHRINAEGINVVDNYIPTGVLGASTRFTSQSATITVSDGRLTLDPLGIGGKNTKINSVQIVATTMGVQTPRVAGVNPVDGATGVPVNISISANDLILPNVDNLGNAGVDNSTITNSTVKLIKVQNGNQVVSSVNGTGGGDAINLVPSAPLEANTEYRFEIDGVLDLVGEPFEIFTSTFTTGSGNTGPITDLDNVSFANAGAVATGSKYSTLTIGPDGKLYGLQINGDIDRWSIQSDGTLSGLEQLDTWKANYNNNRTSVGLTFDPDATAQNLIAYISHDSGGLSGAPAWDGNISRLTGANLETEVLIVTNLPRSKKDHLTNSINFKPGEPNVLYFNQGSNSAAGAPDNAWGNRRERLLSAANLRLDLDLLPESNWPLNAKTTMDPAAINNVDVNSPTLGSTVGTYTEDGQSYSDDGSYNPFYVNAPLTLFGTGIRNAYDLVWHSNGQLYIPANGTAGGSNAPASIDDTRRPNGSFYDYDAVNGNYPIIPASNNNNVQKDWLFRLDPANPLGFYGHPNPLRGEFVLNRGDADVDNTVYNGVVADINYRGDAFDFENNKSPNGVIEYRSNAENGNLTGALLVVRYSGGSDIIALVPDGPNGDIATFKEGIPGFTGFGDPLDLVEDITNGNIYVSDYGRSEIVLLRPSAQAAPEALIVLDTEEVVGDAVTNNEYNQEILLSNLGNATLTGISAQITGADSSQFQVSGLPLTLNTQNSDAFNIIFTPTSVGPKTAQLTISGTGVEDVIIPLKGLGKQGLGGSNEPSLQWVLDTRLGSGAIDVGDENAATNAFDVGGLTEGSDAYKAALSEMLGDELDIQSFERAVDAQVTLELVSVYGPTGSNPVVAFGWYDTGNASATNELFSVTNSPTGNGQRLNPPLEGVTAFDPGTQDFGFYSRWPAFQNRQLFSEDALNTFTGAIPHHVRVYAMPGETDAYIIATEEHISGFDYQDVVVIARNIRPTNGNPAPYCAPISLLACDEIPVTLPFSLDFDGTEGGLSNTGFTMVDNPSVRLDADLPISYPDVLGYEPGKISLGNGNLVLEANNGIAFRTEGAGNTQSTDVNSQVNTLGVGFDADTYGNFSITTTIVNPYTDGSANSEQAGLWFGLNEDNFVKLIADVSGQVELRSELNGLSENVDQVIATVENLNTSKVQLRLFVDIDNNALVAYYTLNSGLEVELGSLPLPSEYLAGNATYNNQSFTGVFATKRRETTANVVYTFEDFAITPENMVVFDPIRINFSLPVDVPPIGYMTDSGLGYEDRGNTYSYGWLTTDGANPLDLSGNTRNREVAGIDILRNTLLHMQYGNAGGTNGNLTEGIWEIEVPNGNYNVVVGVGDPNVDGTAGTEPFHTINVEGTNLIDRYSPFGTEGSNTRFTSGSNSVNVTDGRLTIDAIGGFNTKINSLVITQGTEINEPYFTNVSPADNATDVRINDFQINVEIIVPNDYEINISSLAGNINLFEVTAEGEIVIPSNSNDTGGGDAITLTPLDQLKEFTTYVFKLTSDIEANRRGDLNDRLAFLPFESTFTTGEIDDEVIPNRDLTGVEFTKVSGVTSLGPGVDNQRFSSLVVGPDGKLYASTIGDFNSDGKIYRWDMAVDGTLSNLDILSPVLQGSPHPVTNATGNNDRLIIGLAFDPSSTADNLVAYITHSKASITGGPEWDGKLTRLSGPDLSTVEDVLIHLPRSVNDHLTNSIIFDSQGDMFINQGSNSAGGQPDGNWGNRPERLLSGAVLKLELDKLPNSLPLSVYTTDDIAVINSAPTGSLTMSNGTYNPYATNSPLTIFSSGIRNAYDLVWHSNGWLYVPTNGTAGNNTSSPNSPSTADYSLARRLDGLTTLPSVPALNGGETQKDWLFKTKGGSYHGHPNPYRGEYVLNHGGISYSGLPGQVEASYTDVAKYPDNLQPDPNYMEPAFDFGKNKSPNGAIEYKSDAFGGKLQGLLMVVRFSGQDDLLVLDPKTGGDIAEAYNSIPGLGGFDDPLDVVEDPKTGNIYISEYDRDNNGTPRITLLRAAIPATTGPEIAASPSELIFETTVNNDGNNTDIKTVAVTNDGNEVLNISSASITGDFAAQFDAVQPAGAISINPGESQIYTLIYTPDLDNGNLGYQQASLTIASDDIKNPNFSVGLHALKKAGFEGGEEPALQDVVDALGIGIDVGWTSLTNGTSPNPVGAESEVELWIKAGDAPIKVTPVGRYSPAETLPFGWYTNDNDIIATNEIGILADGIVNAQTLFPPIVSGEASFDPQGAVFGFYVESNTFNRLSYTQDAVNAEQNNGVTHRTRIYPMADRDGNPIENSFLIAFEDASNGDYQDYMFIIDNVIPYESGILALDFDKENLGFIASINQEDIPVQQVTLSGNGGITQAGISLEASEPWIVLPDTYELGTSFDIGVDVAGLSIGSYQATITASAPNYEDAVVNVTLEVTNELVYTYQFNFQDPDDIETSPEGYIDDIGVPYGVQNTANLGDLTFGWVLPSTLTPADAGVNGRNRNTGTNDNALTKTFTIIGHRTASDFPTRDWVINVPNGTYSVNVSVGGDPQFSDSNHVLDVNGITVVDYDQQSIVPETFETFENTKFVDVTDGTLRLALAAGGENAKVNYIRLAPVDVSILPPTIAATFEGNESAPDTYRGTVDITLEATDNSDSGGIARLEYVLDGNIAESYTQPISVGDTGAHSLVVTAEDNNGNITEKAFDFTIEAPTGALLAIENMTKVPGTDRGFPADDYYTFHRLGSPGQALVHDSNVMRLNNTGTGDLIVAEAIVSDTNDYTVEVLDNTGAVATLPVTIAPGSFADLDITFIGTTGNGNNGIFVEDIEIVSNADNAMENTAVLHGAYSPQPEGGDEINAQEVFDAFGFQTSMLSIVNDEGTITPPNNLSFRPSSNFPLPTNVDAGYEGDMILSDNFVQADPTKPVIGIQLSALHGGPSSNGARFVQTGTNTGTVGGINFSHNPAYYQTLLPKAQNSSTVINNDTSSSISESFRIAVSNYLTSGGNNISGDRPDLLGARVYKVIDHNGNVIPNEYIVLQDFVQGGCGAGSANCDWNDNTFYFINIRPEGVPTAQPTEAYLANVGENLDLDIAQYFDKGYPGNSLTITASVANGGLPTWLTYNSVDGTLSGTPPDNTTGSIEVDFDAVDPNGLTASTTLTININEPPIAVDDERTTTQNVAILFVDLLSNDSEPNGQDFSILTLDSPQNGEAQLQADGISILYTPDTDFVGTDTFTYTIEDVSGLTASANVSITVTPENQAPTALIVTSTTEGPAALFVTFTGSGSEDDTDVNLQYAWDFGDGTGASTDPDTSYTFTSAGVYTVSLTVTDSENLFDVATTTITVSTPPNTAPTAVASATASNTNPLQFGFDGSGSSDTEGTVSYQWNFGDGNSSSEVSPSHTYALSGTYDVSLTVTDEGELTDSVSLQVVVEESNTAPTAVASATRNSGNPLQFIFDGSASGDTEGTVSFQWNFGDGNSSSEVSPSHTYALAGPYDVSLTVTDEEGLTDAVTLQVVAENPVTNGFALRINAGGPQVVFNGENFSADTNFTGGKVYVNNSATVPTLYKTERSASPPTFAYNIPVSNGNYRIVLHFAEIYHGATGGGTGGNGKRVFDVTLEGNIVMNDYDINADVGPQTPVTKTFEVEIADGQLNLVFDAAGGDGVDQPKLSGIEVIGIEDPVADCELPVVWTSSDIGAVAAEGATCFDNGRFEVSGSGADIWGSADEFHYVYQQLVGDGEIVAQVLSLNPTSVWAKAGVMMRNDLDANSASAMMIIAPNPNSVGGPGYSFQHRPTKGVTMGNANFTAPVLVPGGYPHYVRMVRSGNTFTSYISETNGNWTQIGAVNITMNQTIFVGLATTSHSDGNLTTAVYDNVSVTKNLLPNEAPTASISANPVSGIAPLLVNFDSSDSTDDTDIVSYLWDFKDGTTSTFANPQHTFAMGTYEVSLTVSDAENETDEATVTITVNALNTAPTALASATPNGDNPLQFGFDGSGSGDTQGAISYDWDFGDGNSSSEVSPQHTYANADTYDVILTVTDEGGLTDSVTLQVVAEAPVTPDFALRINAGGPQLVQNGKIFSADRNFVGGKAYTNVNATLPALYQTERSALPPIFGYEIPLNNGNYKVTLHFAELFWGANGGKPGGVGKRVFDVAIEGNTVLNDYDIIADVGSQSVVTKTFDVVVQDGNLSLALDAEGSDGRNEPKLSAIEIVSVGVVNDAPTAVANSNIVSGEAPLEVSFNANGSEDDKDIVSYLWDFKDGTTSTDENPQHVFETADVYNVTLTVSDAEGETDEAIIAITVEEPVINDFALRINSGGPQVIHNGNTFSADTNFNGGKVYTNISATVANLYKTERSALPPNFAYTVPVENGNYQVVLHFAEIYWGATGGGTGGTGKRVFDVMLEGNTILNDYDINADVGPQTAAVKTFNVAVTDGVLNLVFDASGSDGVDQPKVSGIEILGVGTRKMDPVVDAGGDIEVALPNSFTLNGSGSDPDGGPVSYRWTQIDGPDTALLTNEDTAELTAEVLVEGRYSFRLTVTDDENVSASDEVTITAINPNLEEVWLEAECAIVGSGWTTMNDGSQSGGQYLVPPSNFQSTPSNNASSIVSFDFSVTAGVYKIFGLVKTPSGTQDSFWVRLNGGPWVRWNGIPSSSNFEWHRIHLNEQVSQPRSFELLERVNRIDIGHREGGVGLDKLYVTQTDDIPTGLGGASTNCGEVNPSFDSTMIADNSGNANKTVSAAYNDPISNEVSMYPNAAVSSTQITMSNPEAEITKLYVYDVSGRLIRSYEGLELKTSADAYVLKVSNLNNGIYLLRMVATDGNVFDEKLVVRH